MKRCAKCGEVKPLDQFSRHSGRRDGHQGRCKDCHRADVRAYLLLAAVIARPGGGEGA